MLKLRAGARPPSSRSDSSCAPHRLFDGARERQGFPANSTDGTALRNPHRCILGTGARRREILGSLTRSGRT